MALARDMAAQLRFAEGFGSAFKKLHIVEFFYKVL
jgi:hypothetical protein